MNDELCHLCGVQCNMTSAYHPQSNGLDERFNQTLQPHESEQNSWDEYLDAIYSFHIEYRVGTQPSIHPFFLCMVVTLDCQLISLCSALVPMSVTSLTMDITINNT